MIWKKNYCEARQYCVELVYFLDMECRKSPHIKSRKFPGVHSQNLVEINWSLRKYFTTGSWIQLTSSWRYFCKWALLLQNPKGLGLSLDHKWVLSIHKCETYKDIQPIYGHIPTLKSIYILPRMLRNYTIFCPVDDIPSQSRW